MLNCHPFLQDCLLGSARCVLLQCPLHSFSGQAVLKIHARLWNSSFIEVKTCPLYICTSLHITLHLSFSPAVCNCCRHSHVKRMNDDCSKCIYRMINKSFDVKAVGKLWRKLSASTTEKLAAADTYSDDIVTRNIQSTWQFSCLVFSLSPNKSRCRRRLYYLLKMGLISKVLANVIILYINDGLNWKTKL